MPQPPEILADYLKTIEAFPPPDVLAGFFAPDAVHEEFPNRLFPDLPSEPFDRPPQSFRKPDARAKSQQLVGKREVGFGYPNITRTKRLIHRFSLRGCQLCHQRQEAID